MFNANGIAGSYTIIASSAYGSVSFAMTNTAAGIPATIRVVGRASQAATVVDALQAPARGQAARRGRDTAAGRERDVHARRGRGWLEPIRSGRRCELQRRRIASDCDDDRRRDCDLTALRGQYDGGQVHRDRNAGRRHNAARQHAGGELPAAQPGRGSRARSRRARRRASRPQRAPASRSGSRSPSPTPTRTPSRVRSSRSRPPRGVRAGRFTRSPRSRSRIVRVRTNAVRRCRRSRLHGKRRARWLRRQGRRQACRRGGVRARQPAARPAD